jgi:hypothetical protein
MRRTLLFLALLTVWTALAGGNPLLAGQVMLGRVLSIDKERAEVVVTLVGGEAQGEGMVNDQEIRVTYPPDGIPPRLKEGDLVRIWGDYSTSDPSRFDASHMGYGHGRVDPTGVRSRIGRTRRMGRGGGNGGCQ